MEFKYKNIQIGTLIELRVTEQDIKEERICDFLKINELQLHEVYQSKSIDCDLLLGFSKLLEYDFFRIYSQHILLYAPPASIHYNQQSKKSNKLPSFNKNLYTPEIISFIVQKVEKKEKTIAEIITNYRIPRTTLYKWLKKHKKTDL